MDLFFKGWTYLADSIRGHCPVAEHASLCVRGQISIVYACPRTILNRLNIVRRTASERLRARVLEMRVTFESRSRLRPNFTRRWKSYLTTVVSNFILFRCRIPDLCSILRNLVGCARVSPRTRQLNIPSGESGGQIEVCSALNYNFKLLR